MKPNYHAEVVLFVGVDRELQVEEDPFVGPAKRVLDVIEPDEVGVCIKYPEVSSLRWAVLIVKVAPLAYWLRAQRTYDQLNVVVRQVIRTHLALAVLARVRPVASSDQSLQFI